MTDAQLKPVESLTFEDAMTELETIVKALESGDAPLENSIASYERGVKLRDHCQKKLAEAQAKIEKISISNDGSMKTEPFAEQE